MPSTLIDGIYLVAFAIVVLMLLRIWLVLERIANHLSRDVAKTTTHRDASD